MKITRKLTILLTIICLSCAVQTKADSWVDPTWKEMLDSSDVIALIQYTSDGNFRASAKILNSYKGLLKAGDEIWVSGFSNRFGPIDTMSKGDTYLVFLNLYEPTEKGVERWNEELVNRPERKDFIEALKSRKVFYVWSPTSGDLLVIGEKIQYDFTQTTFYKKQNFHSLHEFELFLQSFSDNAFRISLSKDILNTLKPLHESEAISQNLMKLYLMKYSEYDDIFEKYAMVENTSIKYAIAQLMGNINTEKSRKVLLKLLEDKHSIIQGEAVRQLSREPSDEVGAVILKMLKDANPKNYGPSNIMDPVMNHVDGGKYQIIKTLGDIGYKPAIPDLLALLETKDDEEFEIIVVTLRKLGTRDYAKYINKHLENLDNKMVYQLCRIIRDDSLTECIPSLMNFVKRHDKTTWPTEETAISTYSGLAYFKTDTVKQFLYADFLELMKMPATSKKSPDTKQRWVNAYIQSFIDLGIRVPKDILYDFMYDYSGINSTFKINSKFFQKKHDIEDSLVNIVEKVLKPLEPTVQVAAIAQIDNELNLVNYTVKYRIKKPENFDMRRKNRLDTLNQILFANTLIDKKHLIWSTENYTSMDGATNFEGFGRSSMDYFLNYISTFPDKEDCLFIENLIKFNYAKSDYDIEKLDKYLRKAKTINGIK